MQPQKNKTRRKAVIVPAEELDAWRQYFKLFGTKAECCDETKVATSTLDRVLERGQGEESVVVRLRDFLSKMLNPQAA